MSAGLPPRAPDETAEAGFVPAAVRAGAEALKFGRRILYRRSSLLAWLRARERQGAAA